jgi:hypothetical protein
MNLSEAKSFDAKAKDYRYDAAHREASENEQLQPCTCQIKAKDRLGGVSYPSLIELQDADPDCELHFPWMLEDDRERVFTMRTWMAGYQVGYNTAFETGRQAALEEMGFLSTD